MNTTTQEVQAEQVIEDAEVMYDILIDLYAGEHGYSEHIYYFGTFDAARRYANSYLETIWGEGETTYDDIDEFYMAKDGERSAQLGNITTFRFVPAGSAKGTFHFEPTGWRII